MKVKIEGNLIFNTNAHQAIVIEDYVEGKDSVLIIGNTVITTSPKWYQVRAWYRLIQLIRKHTSP